MINFPKSLNFLKPVIIFRILILDQLLVHLYCSSFNVQNIQIQRQKSRLVVAMSWEEERMDSDYLMGMGFLEGNENVLKIMMFAQLREYTKTH